MVENSKYALLVAPVKRFKGAQSLSSVWRLQYLLVRTKYRYINRRNVPEIDRYSSCYLHDETLISIHRFEKYNSLTLLSISFTIVSLA